MLFVCYSLLNRQNISINNSEKMVGYLDTSDVAKKAEMLHRKRSNN